MKRTPFWALRPGAWGLPGRALVGLALLTASGVFLADVKGSGVFFGGTVLIEKDSRPLQTPAPKGQRPDLKRPTKKDDPVPPFDYDHYFPGKWTFEWRVPESPLGSAGTITGTELFSTGSGGSYESVIQATGPDGPFTVKSTITYDVDQRRFTRREHDSRGFEVVKTGSIGGDLGGFYTIHYESEPFTYKGRKIRLKTITRLVSPLNFKVQAQIAVDDQPYTSFGNPWWQKQM